MGSYSIEGPTGDVTIPVGTGVITGTELVRAARSNGKGQFNEVLLPYCPPSPTSTYNVMNFGAVGDGNSRQLRNVKSCLGYNTSGWTLAQWQSLFPLVVTGPNLPDNTATYNSTNLGNASWNFTNCGGLKLTSELDWAAICQAMAAADLTIPGGSVYFPAGTYVCNQLLYQLPECGEGVTGAISLYGAGSDSTAITLTQEATTSPNTAFFLACANRAATGQGSAGIISGIRFVGPINSQITWGNALGNTSGIGWSARRKLFDVQVQLFYAGIAICGDQTHFDMVNTFNCTYGLYWDVSNSSQLIGDLMFTRCILANSFIAHVAVSHTAFIGKSVFNKCITGYGPFCFMKETNNGTPTQVQFINGCTFVNHQFENVGIAAIGEDLSFSAQAATNGINQTGRVSFISGSNSFINCQWGAFNAAVLPNSKNVTAMIDIGGSNGEIFIDGVNIGSSWAPGSRGLFNCGYHTMTVMKCDFDAIIALVAASSAPAAKVFGSGTVNNGTVYIQSHLWSGELAYGVGVTANAQAYVSGSRYQTAFTTGTAADKPYGVSMYQFTDGITVVARTGQVKVNTNGTYTPNTWASTTATTGSLSSTVTTAAHSWVVGKFLTTYSGYADLDLVSPFYANFP